MTAIFVASAQPRLPLQNQVPDYLSHAAAYLVLAALWCWGLARGGAPTLRIALAAVLASALYGATDEWHQSFVPGRHAEARDVRNDTVGAAVGATLYAVAFAARRRRGAVEAA
ncbi:MAG: VanZ family protein [Vicinamibacteria bacterium]